MTVDSFSAQDTFALGQQIGEAAVPGEVYTLTGDLGVGKTIFTQLLQYCRFMRKGGFLFTISMFTVSVVRKRWTKSAMKIIFMEMVYASSNGPI